MSAFVLHGHFYQPPRENPWTESVPKEVTAAPFHDWNERITAECYRPNAFARIMDESNRVLAIVNNFELISFDLGPTLAMWLAEHRPEVLDRIIEADGVAGTAIAHPFHHSILPLSPGRDARTEIRWGIADFRYRFGRDPQGFWLPECALDDATLALLVEEGISFTVVAPGQIDAVPVGVPARWHHPDGRPLDLVVYDGELSQSLAFGMSEVPADTLFDEVARRTTEPLVVGATDGETFGHHHKYTERAIAYGFAVLAKRSTITTGSLPTVLSAIGERLHTKVRPSAWSCAHGLGRWERDCGCSNGGQPGWNQAWRAPLRRALDVLRDDAHHLFDARGSVLFADHWAARDAYIDTIIGATSVNDFAAQYILDGVDVSEALSLLEMERHALAMYTSCGWFFADLAGHETIQILRYAARCMDLMAEVGHRPPIEEVLVELATAQSNDPAEGDGRRVWERRVLSGRVDAERIVAHLALIELLRGGISPTIGPFAVQVERHARTVGPMARLETGRVRLTHRRTRRSTWWSYAVAGDDAYDVLGAVAPLGGSNSGDPVSFDAIAVELHRMASTIAPLSQLQDRIVARHGGRRFGLDVLVMDFAPRVAVDLSGPALLALTRRAIATGTPGHIRAARRFMRALVAAGISTDLAQAQEAFYRANEEGELGSELSDLGRDLGLAVGSLGLPT